MTDLWSYRDTARSRTTDLVGFQVVATDSAIGKSAGATSWSIRLLDLRQKRMLPAGVIDRIDYDGREVHVSLTKDKIRQAPNYDAERKREEAYQDDGTYYGP
jgi:hypothetical protein